MTSDKPKEKGIKEFKENFQKEIKPSTQGVETVNTVVGTLNRYTDKIRTNKNIELSGDAILRLPNVTALSSTCAIGDLVVNSGILYVCSAVNTWTKVGLQS